MTALEFGEFKLTETMDRERGINVQGNRQPLDNPATMRSGSWTARSDGKHGIYKPIVQSLFGSLVNAGPSAFTGSATFAASGNTIGATGIGTSLVAGDFVWVTGATLNGSAFLVRLSAASANLVTVDADWKTLVNETVSITLWYTGRYRIGNSILAFTAELWRANALPAAHGDVGVGLGATSMTWSFDHPSPWQISYQGVALNVARAAAALANGTTTPTQTDIWRSGELFGRQDLAAAGCGLRYAGSLLPDLSVKSLEVTLTNPLEIYGRAGSIDGYSLDEQQGQLRELTVNMTVYRDSADAEDLIDDASDPNTVASLSFGQADPQGNLTVFHMPALQAMPADRSGVEQGGKPTFSIQWMGRYDATHSMFQITEIAAS
jgi:hypothetical protein